MRLSRDVRLLLIVGGLSFVTTEGAAQVTLLPYGASGYRYSIVGSFPAGVESPGFDDSGFSVGSAPFTSGSSCANGSAIYSPGTVWPVSTLLVARFHLTLPGPAVGATVSFGIDNDVTLYLNGQLLGTVVHEGCADYGQQGLAIPDGLLQLGQNVLVALAVDRGGISALDLTMWADAITSTPQRSWGHVKTLYR